MNASISAYKVGACNVCEYERMNRSGRTRNAIKVSYVTIPESAEPREGIVLLAENAGISQAEATDVLNPDKDTRLNDIIEVD